MNCGSGSSSEFYYVQGDFGDSAAYQRLKDQIIAVEKNHSTQGNRFHYLAVAPKFFSPIVKKLGEAGLTQETDETGLA